MRSCWIDRTAFIPLDRYARSLHVCTYWPLTFSSMFPCSLKMIQRIYRHRVDAHDRTGFLASFAKQRLLAHTLAHHPSSRPQLDNLAGSSNMVKVRIRPRSLVPHPPPPPTQHDRHNHHYRQHESVARDPAPPSPGAHRPLEQCTSQTAHILVLGAAFAVGRSVTTTSSTDCNVDESSRSDCGYVGIDQVGRAGCRWCGGGAGRFEPSTRKPSLLFLLISECFRWSVHTRPSTPRPHPPQPHYPPLRCAHAHRYPLPRARPAARLALDLRPSAPASPNPTCAHFFVVPSTPHHTRS